MTRLAGFVLFWSAQAVAGSLYLNGVNIDGVTNQKFEKCTVRIDEKGNVFIEAPGYQVKAVEGGKPKAGDDSASTRVTRRYFLVTEQALPGMAEFDVDVYINAKWYRTLKSGEDQIVSEITKQLLPGKNTVVLTARKVAGTPRKSFSPEHFLRVIIGEGDMGGDNVMIDKAMVKFERTAAETSDVSQEFVITTR